LTFYERFTGEDDICYRDCTDVEFGTPYYLVVNEYYTARSDDICNCQTGYEWMGNDYFFPYNGVTYS
jgi:hypothetical protein